MGLAAVSKKEFLDTVRSNTLLAITVTFVLWAGFLAVIRHVPVTVSPESGLPTETLALLNSMQQSAVFFVPLIGLGLGYNAIVGERERGSLWIVLGLPNARRDVVVGKFIGRTAVITVAILVAYATVAVIVLATYDTFHPTEFALYTLLTVFYGAVYVGIGIGFSAFMKSRQTAFAAASGLYVLFLLGWDVVLLLLQLLTVGQEVPEGGLPDWIQFVGVLNPSTAFGYATRGAIPEFRGLVRYPESDALYLHDGVGIVVLALWLCLPVAIGYARFARADLK